MALISIRPSLLPKQISSPTLVIMDSGLALFTMTFVVATDLHPDDRIVTLMV